MRVVHDDNARLLLTVCSTNQAAVVDVAVAVVVAVAVAVDVCCCCSLFLYHQAF